MNPSKALTIKKHEAQLRVYVEAQLSVYAVVKRFGQQIKFEG